MNRRAFFDTIRPSLFSGSLSQSQVQGLDVLLDVCLSLDPPPDIRKVAYGFSTDFHETAATMQPIEEYGKGEGKDYGEPDPITGEVYYGRGLVQLTWADNYKRMGDVINQPLYENPSLALELPIAGEIMFYGMRDGLFTGKSLKMYFNNDVTDFYNARRIINGLDRAEDLARYAEIFLEALALGGYPTPDF